MRKLIVCGVALVAALALTVPGALGSAEQAGITAKTITIGGTFPLTGPAAAYAPIPVGMKAYFSYINARRGPDGKRGIYGRQIVWKYYDDGYNPANTVQLTRRLVEQEGVSEREEGCLSFPKIFEKIRLATVGNATCRKVLVRDSNRLVAMAVVRSPQITDMEIRQIASSTNVCDDVIRYIANNREYAKDYGVKLALVGNPKCPVGLSLRFLSYLRLDDLRNLSRSKNVPGALATAAKKLLEQREGGRK